MTESSSNLPRPNPDHSSLELTEEYIRLRAYQIYEQRGCEHGHDVEHGLLAEAEIVGKRIVAPADAEKRETDKRVKARSAGRAA